MLFTFCLWPNDVPHTLKCDQFVSNAWNIYLEARFCQMSCQNLSFLKLTDNTCDSCVNFSRKIFPLAQRLSAQLILHSSWLLFECAKILVWLQRGQLACFQNETREKASQVHLCKDPWSEPIPGARHCYISLVWAVCCELHNSFLKGTVKTGNAGESCKQDNVSNLVESAPQFSLDTSIYYCYHFRWAATSFSFSFFRGSLANLKPW